MANETAHPDLYLLGGVSPVLEATLAERFTLHRKDPPATTRAIVGGGSSVVDATLLDSLPALEIIAINGVGYDGIDLAATKARGIAVTTTPDVLTDDVADLAIGLMLAVQRRIVANDRAVRDGGWQVALSRRASGRRIGIFGLGRIGKAIAGARRRLRASSIIPHAPPSRISAACSMQTSCRSRWRATC